MNIESLKINREYHDIDPWGIFYKDFILNSNENKIQSQNREPIPENIRHEVWRRDEGKCVECGSKENLEFDHIIPFSKGGANTARNLQLLCESCNRKKSDKI